MANIKFNLIAAACENMGIGVNGTLPWRLKSEMEYFTKMTSATKDPNKQNVVIMGRKTWDSIPKKYKPLSNRINFILSNANTINDLSAYENCYHFHNWTEVQCKLQETNFQLYFENVWIIGGRAIYADAMKMPHFHRLYLTKICKSFNCDTFFPKLGDNLKLIQDDRVPDGIQEENNIQFVYNVYENTQFTIS